jgi:histidinol-phosphate aminotransferase
MSYFRKNIDAAEGYTPGEQPQDGEFVKLNTNENPYGPSPKVIEAIREASGDDLRKYPDPFANEARDVIAKLFGVKRDNVICGNGSDDILAVAIGAMVDPGQSLAVPDPTYSLYETLVAIQDARLERHPCGDDFAVPVDALAASGAPLVIVANPNAPTGVATPTGDLRRIARGISGVLLVDEAYADFADANAMELALSEPNVLVMRTLSKSYSLAGIRFGFAVGSAALVAGLMKARDSYPCDRLSIAAARAALEDQPWMQANVAKIRDERSRLTAALRRLGFTVLESQANFLFARPPRGDAEMLYEKLKERRILVRYFKGQRVDEFLRITIGTPHENDALLDALKLLLT